MRWRVEMARAAGLPPLELMEGFWFIDKPVTGNRSGAVMRGQKVSYDHAILCGAVAFRGSVKPDPAHVCFCHPDNEGIYTLARLQRHRGSLESLIRNCRKRHRAAHWKWRDKTQTFIDRLRRAYEAKENVDFR